jgi:hypothetical protein
MSKNKKKCCCVPKPPNDPIDPPIVVECSGSASSVGARRNTIWMKFNKKPIVPSSPLQFITSQGQEYFKVLTDCTIEITPDAATSLITTTVPGGAKEVYTSALCYCNVGNSPANLNNHPINNWIGNNVTNNTLTAMLINNSTIIKLKKNDVLSFWVDFNNNNPSVSPGSGLAVILICNINILSYT